MVCIFFVQYGFGLEWCYIVKVLLRLRFLLPVLCVLRVIISEGLFFFVFVRCFVFGSNVQPKRKIKEQRKEPWYCYHCDLEHPNYYSKCPKCGEHRPS